MTMQHDVHPHDERLAALAGNDPDVAGDVALRAHVTTCDRCGGLVAELTTLRTALAELPDLAPSRRIQLVPPVAVPAASGAGRPAGWLRRLWGPVMVAGAGMALIGAVGLVGASATSLGGAPAGADETEDRGVLGMDPMSIAPEEAETTEDGDAAAAPSGAEGVPRQLDSASPPAEGGGLGAGEPTTQQSRASAAADPQPSRDGNALFGAESGPPGNLEVPWLAVLVAGLALMVAALLLRFRVQPRAG